mmetsp:Transcript_14760/g.37267  ORF Transcript_14760/g.37267 Transcript_14760/m.37267 type:complete len:292 (-) Transcript_14760:3444-4319(-)
MRGAAHSSSLFPALSPRTKNRPAPADPDLHWTTGMSTPSAPRTPAHAWRCASWPVPPGPLPRPRAATHHFTLSRCTPWIKSIVTAHDRNTARPATRASPRPSTAAPQHPLATHWNSDHCRASTRRLSSTPPLYTLHPGRTGRGEQITRPSCTPPPANTTRGASRPRPTNDETHSPRVTTEIVLGACSPVRPGSGGTNHTRNNPPTPTVHRRQQGPGAPVDPGPHKTTPTPPGSPQWYSPLQQSWCSHPLGPWWWWWWPLRPPPPPPPPSSPPPAPRLPLPPAPQPPPLSPP